MENKILIWIIVFLLVPLVYADNCIEGQCYDCDGELVERDGKIVCLNCNEEFTLIDGSCQVIPKAVSNPTFIDKFLYKYFPQSPMLGFLILIVIICMAIYVFKNRKPLVRRFKNAVK